MCSTCCTLTAQILRNGLSRSGARSSRRSSEIPALGSRESCAAARRRLSRPLEHSGSRVDALLVGYYVGRELRFAAKVRAGFVPRLRRDLFAKLEPLETPRCPFADLPTGKSRWVGGVAAEDMREMRWIKPRLVAQIRFVEWTADGRLRHAVYLGLRDDKKARDTRRK